MSDAAYFMTEGQELYAIVPPNDKGRITIYASEITEEGEYIDEKSTRCFKVSAEKFLYYAVTSARFIPMY